MLWVGLRADGNDVIVDLERPGADFPAIVSGPTFGIVPPLIWRDGSTVDGGFDVPICSVSQAEDATCQ